MLREFAPPHTMGISSMHLLQNEASLLVTSLDHTATLWDLRQQESATGPQATLAGHRDAINNAVVLPDGTSIVTCSDDRTVRLWDQRKLSEPTFTCTGFAEGINKMCLSTDGTLLYSAADDGLVYVHRVQPNLPLHYRFMASTEPLNDVLCIPGAEGGPGDILVTGCDGKALRTWLTGRIDDKPEGSEGEDRMVASLEAFEQSVNHVVHHNNWLYAASADTILAVDFDPATGQFGGGGRGYVGHQDWVRGMGFINNGQTLVSVADDRTAMEWSVEDTTALAGAQLHNDNIMAMALSADGTNLFTGCEDGTMRQWLVPLPRSVEPQN